MADEEEIRSDEEYQYSEEEPDIFTMPEDIDVDAGEARKRLFRRNILIAFGIVLLLFGAYRVYKMFTKPDVIVPVQPQVTAPAPTPQPITDQPALASQLAALSSANTKSRAQMEQLASGVAKINSSLSDLDSRISSLDTSLRHLSDQVSQQQAQITALKLKKKVRQVKKPIIRTIYYVQALIPGRAWLKNDAGMTHTVGVGDKVPGYGVVREIDPKTGVLLTSSGRVIQYSPDDR